MVAQVDEQKPAMVADAVPRAGQTNLLADVGVAERAAGVGAITMHGIPGKRQSESGIGSRWVPAKERQGLPEANRPGNRMGDRLPRQLPIPGAALSSVYDGAFSFRQQ